MLRVSDVWERALHTPGVAITKPGEVIIIRSERGSDGQPGMSLSTGVTGSRGLCLHLVMIPPGTRGVPHMYEAHESAIYTVSGQTEVWHGEGLQQRAVVQAGDFMYIPPGTPHLAVNRADVMTVAVVARTDPGEQEGAITLSLPEHLAELDAFPVAGPVTGPAAS